MDNIKGRLLILPQSFLCVSHRQAQKCRMGGWMVKWIGNWANGKSLRVVISGTKNILLIREEHLEIQQRLKKSNTWEGITLCMSTGLEKRCLRRFWSMCISIRRAGVKRMGFSNRKRGNGHKMKHRKFWLNKRKKTCYCGGDGALTQVAQGGCGVFLRSLPIQP